MAEYKQYITQIQENGSVMISEDVVATIVAHALSEVEGVGSLGIKPGVSINPSASMTSSAFSACAVHSASGINAAIFPSSTSTAPQGISRNPSAITWALWISVFTAYRLLPAVSGLLP